MSIEQAFRITFSPYVSIRIIHHYFLDAGLTRFGNLSNALRREKLDQYDIRNVLEIRPTAATERLLNGHRMVFKTSATGFTIWVNKDSNDRPEIAISPDLKLDFLVFLKDLNFFKYTELPDDGLPVIDRGGVQRKSYYVFSNVTGGGFPNLAANGTEVSMQDRIDHDPQAIPEVVPAGTFALISLSGRAQGNGDYHLIKNNGKLALGPTDFLRLRFRNRSTWWRYIKGQQLATSTSALPLTTSIINPVQTDIWGVSDLPNPEVYRVKADPLNPSRLISEMYLE